MKHVIGRLTLDWTTVVVVWTYGSFAAVLAQTPVFSADNIKQIQLLIRQRRDGFEGGGSIEGGESRGIVGGIGGTMGSSLNLMLLQALLAASAAAPPAAPATPPAAGSAPPAAPATPNAAPPQSNPVNPALLSALLPLLMNQQQGGFGGGYRPEGDDDPKAILRAKRRARFMENRAPASDPCDSARLCADLPLDAIARFGDHLLAFREDRVYFLRYDGAVMEPEPRNIQELFPGFAGAKSNVSAALNFGDSFYLFHDDKVTQYLSDRLPAKPRKAKTISSVFPGISGPINGATSLDDHTIGFFEGRVLKQYCQTNASIYGIKLLEAFGQNMTRTDLAFDTKFGRRFIVEGTTVYELDDKLKVVERRPFTTESGSDGWLRCPSVEERRFCKLQKGTARHNAQQSSEHHSIG